MAKIIFLYRSKTSTKFPFTFHSSCRNVYTDSTRILYAKRSREESEHAQRDEDDLAPPPKRLSRLQRLIGTCIVSFARGRRTIVEHKTGRNLSLVNMNPTSMRAAILATAYKRQDETVIKRLTHETDLFAVNARYHRHCVQSYCSTRNIEATKKTI